MAKLYSEAVVPTVSSNPILLNEKFAAWERWSPGALRDDPLPRREPESQDAIKRRGYAAGFEEGKRAGFQTGHAEGKALARAEVARIHAVASSADEALQALGDTLSRKTVALAVAIAQKVMQREIKSHPESILHIVHEGLILLPDNAERVRITVNTDDLELVRGNLSETEAPADYVVAGSNEVQRGGCLITSPCGDIDATLETRMRRVLEVLGMQEDKNNV